MDAPGREAMGLTSASSPLQSTSPMFLYNPFPRSSQHISPYISFSRTVSYDNPYLQGNLGKPVSSTVVWAAHLCGWWKTKVFEGCGTLEDKNAEGNYIQNNMKIMEKRSPDY